MKWLLLSLLLCSFVSCRDSKEVPNEDTTVLLEEEPKEEKNPENIVPPDNPILMAIRDEKVLSFKEADALYKTCMENAEKAQYLDELKHIGFQFMCTNKLVEEGSEADKRFYIQEQMELDCNVQCSDEFFDLLKASSTFMTREELMATAQEFHEKNTKAFATLPFPDEYEKKKARVKLDLGYVVFKNEMTAAVQRQ